MTDASPSSITLTSHSPDETTRLARALADIAGPGLVICLWGDVGAGKTYFARQMIQTLQARHGTAEDVPSPTFTLVQTYHADTLEIWHADLYRLSGPDEVYELGLIAAFETAFCMIEWPDRLGDLVPPNAVHMTFSHAEDPELRLCEIACADTDLLTQFADHIGGDFHG